MLLAGILVVAFFSALPQQPVYAVCHNDKGTPIPCPTAKPKPQTGPSNYSQRRPPATPVPTLTPLPTPVPTNTSQPVSTAALSGALASGQGSGPLSSPLAQTHPSSPYPGLWSWGIVAGLLIILVLIGLWVSERNGRQWNWGLLSWGKSDLPPGLGSDSAASEHEGAVPHLNPGSESEGAVPHLDSYEGGLTPDMKFEYTPNASINFTNPEDKAGFVPGPFTPGPEGAGNANATLNFTDHITDGAFNPQPDPPGDGAISASNNFTEPS